MPSDCSSCRCAIRGFNLVLGDLRCHGLQEAVALL